MFDVLTEPHLADAEQSIISSADELRKLLVGNATQIEIASWSNKAERARRVLSGNDSETDKQVLQQEAINRGKNETTEQLAAKQLEKEALFANAIATIDGLQSFALNYLEQRRPSPFEVEEFLKKVADQKQTIEQKFIQLLNP